MFGCPIRLMLCVGGTTNFDVKTISFYRFHDGRHTGLLVVSFVQRAEPNRISQFFTIAEGFCFLTLVPTSFSCWVFSRLGLFTDNCAKRNGTFPYQTWNSMLRYVKRTLCERQYFIQHRYFLSEFSSNSWFFQCILENVWCKFRQNVSILIRYWCSCRVRFTRR